MTSVTATSLADTLPSSVPKLDASGLNWAVFSLRFRDAIEAKGYWGHFDGTSKHPITPKPEDLPVKQPLHQLLMLLIPAAPSAEDLAAAISQWDKDERSAKSLLTQKIPDSALMRIRNKKTVKERWDAITSEYTQEGHIRPNRSSNVFPRIEMS